MNNERENPASALSQQLRDSGFSEGAKALPRSDVALRLLCAFNGVPLDKAPPGWHFHPNTSTRDAWERVADEAKRIFGEQQQS